MRVVLKAVTLTVVSMGVLRPKRNYPMDTIKPAAIGPAGQSRRDVLTPVLEGLRTYLETRTLLAEHVKTAMARAPGLPRTDRDILTVLEKHLTNDDREVLAHLLARLRG